MEIIEIDNETTQRNSTTVIMVGTNDIKQGKLATECISEYLGVTEKTRPRWNQVHSSSPDSSQVHNQQTRPGTRAYQIQHIPRNNVPQQNSPTDENRRIPTPDRNRRNTPNRRSQQNNGRYHNRNNQEHQQGQSDGSKKWKGTNHPRQHKKWRTKQNKQTGHTTRLSNRKNRSKRKKSSSSSHPKGRRESHENENKTPSRHRHWLYRKPGNLYNQRRTRKSKENKRGHRENHQELRRTNQDGNRK